MSEQTTGKGRPTPKRNEATKRRTGPVAPPPTSRREAAKQLRAKNAANRQRIKSGSKTGDEAALLPRDQGPVRKLVRDMIDERRTLGWILMPMAIVVLVTGFTKNNALNAVAFEIWLAALLAAAVESVFTGTAVSKAIKERFPDEPKWKGHIRYGVMRTLTIRRLRVPRPAPRG